jgi:uncharacterized membrane protein
MIPARRTVILAVSGCAIIAAVLEYAAVPQVARLIPGLVLTLVLPGFAVVDAVVSVKNMAFGERLLASVGVSIVITVCTSVLLDATIGLSQHSVAAALGAVTLAGCAFAWIRERRGRRSFSERDRPLWRL